MYMLVVASTRLLRREVNKNLIMRYIWFAYTKYYTATKKLELEEAKHKRHKKFLHISLARKVALENGQSLSPIIQRASWNNK